MVPILLPKLFKNYRSYVSQTMSQTSSSLCMRPSFVLFFLDSIFFQSPRFPFDRCFAFSSIFPLGHRLIWLLFYLLEVTRWGNLNIKQFWNSLYISPLALGLLPLNAARLKIENQTLNEKIEERNEELHKLRKKTIVTVQIITHMREKVQVTFSSLVSVHDGIPELCGAPSASYSRWCGVGLEWDLLAGFGMGVATPCCKT